MGVTLVPGDVVHAAAGTYKDGKMIQESMIMKKDLDPSPYVYSRVVVPKNVTLVGDGGRDATIIEGAVDTSSAEGEKYGRGPNAIRCVFLNSGAVIDGFTLHNGRTDCVQLESDNNIGGGVLGLQNDPKICNCTIENCASVRGGAVYGCQLYNCRVVNNIATWNAIVRNCRAYNSYFGGNKGSEAVIQYFGSVVNCTVAADNVKEAATSQALASFSYQSSDSMANCLFYGNAMHLLSIENCVAKQGVVIGFDATEPVSNNVQFASLENLQLTEHGVPIVGKCAAIDQGDASLYPSDYTTAIDCDGNSRVRNGKMDVGAYEADWNATYASALGPRITVTEAGDNVRMESASATCVKVPAGEAFAISWANNTGAALEHRLGTRVTGTGTLDVALNGEDLGTVTAAEGDKTLKFTNANASNSLAFSYAEGESDTGLAELYGFRQQRGLLVILQ